MDWDKTLLSQVDGEEQVAYSRELAAKIEPFDSFWEAPEDIESGYTRFGQFYRANYLPHLRVAKNARILAVSCGPGYFVELTRREGYTHVLGIDSDAEKVAYATRRGLSCRVERAFPFLQNSQELYDLIFAEQEINHLTKDEMVDFLKLCHANLRPGGQLIVHCLNGANPITGAEALAQNFDHFNTLTEYSLRQVLSYSGFREVRVFPLNLYVFYGNPLNYLGMLATGLLEFFFRLGFLLYGKKNRIFSKKIAAIGVK
jgi:2-polyprenyl-3-methyl-5-hydroxy-6-metoxy-1,4-benzoquinol methylase